MNLYEYAKYNGLSMAELGKRGGKKAGHRRRVTARQKRAFEALKSNGGDWWNK